MNAESCLILDRGVGDFGDKLRQGLQLYGLTHYDDNKTWVMGNYGLRVSVFWDMNFSPYPMDSFA